MQNSKFKVGDRVRVRLDNLVSSNGIYCFTESNIYERFKGVLIITKTEPGSSWQNKCVIEIPSNDGIWLHNDELELVSSQETSNTKNTINTKNTNKTMSLIQKLKSITRTEPNKSFVKIGVLNEDLELTTEGKDLFIQYMFEKHANDFKKDVVDTLLEESKD